MKTLNWFPLKLLDLNKVLFYTFISLKHSLSLIKSYTFQAFDTRTTHSWMKLFYLTCLKHYLHYRYVKWLNMFWWFLCLVFREWWALWSSGRETRSWAIRTVWSLWAETSSSCVFMLSIVTPEKGSMSSNQRWLSTASLHSFDCSSPADSPSAVFLPTLTSLLGPGRKPDLILQGPPELLPAGSFGGLICTSLYFSPEGTEPRRRHHTWDDATWWNMT